MKNVTISIKDFSEAGFTGYGSVFGLIDRHTDIIAPGAFKNCLGAFLDEGFIGGVGHDHNRPIGKPVEAYEDNKGLFVKAKFSDVPAAHEARQLIADRVVTKLSIGFDIDSFKLMKDAEVTDMWAQMNYRPTAEDQRRLKRAPQIRVITEVKTLFEISPVAIPSNDACVITGMKTALPNIDPYLKRLKNQFRSVLNTDAENGRYERAQAMITQFNAFIAGCEQDWHESYINSDAFRNDAKSMAESIRLKLQIQKLRGNHG